jgi:GTP-binding protein YchF
VHVDGQVDPKRDIETINLELVFADLETVEKRMEKTRKMMKSGDRKYQAELALQEKIKSHLEKGMPVRSMSFDEDEAAYVRQLFLLTSKPVLYCANVDEEALSDIDSNLYVRTVRAMAEAENSESVVICARIEEEIAQLDDDERKLFLRELGLEESGLDKLVRASYKLLGLISFLTIGDDEVRAWTIVKGTKAPQAAGKVHSDFEKGFIRAEVVAFDDLMRCGSYAAAREQGLVRSEGRDYVMKDGDVALFRFNV